MRKLMLFIFVLSSISYSNLNLSFFKSENNSKKEIIQKIKTNVDSNFVITKKQNEISKDLTNDDVELGDSDVKPTENPTVITNVIEYTKPKTNLSISETEAKMRIALLKNIQKHLNKPYLWGASGRQKFDCSSLIQAVYKDTLNVNVPRVSYQQAKYLGKQIPLGKMRVGDLIFMDTLKKGRVTHVGMYVGNGEMIHASSKYGKVVRVKFDGFYKDTFIVARSLFA